MDELHSFKLVEITEETLDVKTYKFEHVGVEPFSWIAGQYLDWQLPHANADDRGERRWFSVASSPLEGQVWLSSRFTDEGSTLKKRILKLSVGDIVDAKGPSGEFTLETVQRPVVMIAGGIGITPFRGIIVDHARKGTLDNITLFYGNRVADNVPFIDEMLSLADQHQGFKVHLVYSPDVISADYLKNSLGHLSGYDFMISGLEKMVISIQESLIAAGVEPIAVRIDDFGGYDHDIVKPVF